ncbi:CHAT domain-containing protein [Lentzea sp. NPDC058450]|uniref:CHAT domain-containing protein n=1 Tax=Lentzea sp. NPDC058450 TaxID=3346505 RepID=UPI00365B6AE7
MGNRARFAAIAAVVLALVAWGAWVGWRRYTLAYLPPDSVFGNTGYVYDPGTGRSQRVLAPGPITIFTFPALMLVLAAFTISMVRGHLRDIGIGWRALRDRPLGLGLATALMFLMVPCCVFVPYWIHTAGADISLSRYLEIGFFTDIPVTVTIGGAMLVAGVFLVVAAPWLFDLFPRLLRLMAVRRMINAGRAAEPGVQAEVARLEREFVQYPYRSQLTMTVLARTQLAKLDDGEPLDDAMLRTMATLPGLEERSWSHVLSPMLDDVDARYQFAETLVTAHVRTDAGAHLDVAIRLLEGLHRRPHFTVRKAQRAKIALTLAHALVLRDTPADTARAQVLMEKAAQATPDEARLMRAILLMPTDLDEAITLLREIGEPEEMRLAGALVVRYERDQDPADLHEVVGLTGRWLAEPGEDRSDVLDHRLNALGHLGDFESPDLLDALERVDALPAPPWQLVHFATAMRGIRALESGDSDGALAHFEQVLRIVVRAASLGLSRADRQAVLNQSRLAPATVATLALTAGRVERAVELLELSRTVIWAQVRELRTTTGDEPRIAEISAALQQPGHDAGADDDLLAGHRQAVTRAELAREWDELAQRRAFGHEIRFADLREAAADGPVVLVNASAERCDAIIVLADGAPVHVPLPDLTEDDARAWAEGLLDAPTRRMNARVIAPRLWDAVAAPVLDAVEPHLGQDRRIWWCPTGALTPVPLHVAGRDEDSVLDRVVSSYTPSLWSLLDARRAHRPVAEPSMLITSLEETPPGTSWAPLPHADEEASLLAARVAGAVRLAEGTATVAAVKAALPGSTWAHFACHGDMNGLVLHDGSLGLDELAGMETGANEVAFLSACVTAVPDSANLDEALHPAAALHLHGFSHVVGTLWHMRSEDGPVVADEFYTHLLAGSSPALALHAAQRALRSRAPQDPARWAPFVHIGP